MDGVQGNDVLLRRGTVESGNTTVRVTISVGFVPIGVDRQIGV